MNTPIHAGLHDYHILNTLPTYYITTHTIMANEAGLSAHAQYAGSSPKRTNAHQPLSNKVTIFAIPQDYARAGIVALQATTD